MRYFLLFLTLVLQLNVSGYNAYNPQENHAQKTLTSEYTNANERSDILFRYYSPEEGMYLSQDPIGLNGGMKLYGYVTNPNKYIDLLGLAKSCTSGENSKAKTGRQKHDEYKKEEAMKINDPQKFRKEYTVTLANGKKGRIDAIDFENKTIYELKPNNPKAIKRGEKQLSGYKEAMEKETGGQWKVVLDKY
jgi:RHS repeat-associated protein